MKVLSLTITVLLLATIAITGCEKKAPKVQANIEKVDNILSHQIDALDKAKDVERQLNEATEKQRKMIEDMTK